MKNTNTNTTYSARAAWEAMTDAEKVEALENMTKHAKKRDGAETDRNGRLIPAVMDWATTADDMDTIRNEAFLALLDSMGGEKWKDGDALALHLYRAARTAAKRIKREIIRNASALKIDGHTGSAYIIDGAAPIADPIAPPPEELAAVLDKLERAARDEKDLAVLEFRRRGWTLQEVAAVLNMSAPAVKKRLDRMHKHYHDDAPAAAPKK